MDATTETFAQCRAEVRQFVKKFANWPRGSSNALLPAESTCAPIDFSPLTEFTARPPVCPLRVWIWCLRTDCWYFEPTAIFIHYHRVLCRIFCRSVHSVAAVVQNCSATGCNCSKLILNSIYCRISIFRLMAEQSSKPLLSTVSGAGVCVWTFKPSNWPCCTIEY